uniref:CD276 antigen homolog n=1 Tax=Monopterus albus TaxID=43700 RepID=UPI0009B3F9CA|nr:CD276 antigen homolog [Monopterus albus]XP_020462146.1 CD276 antigen homolog [Monopterus albus]
MFVALLAFGSYLLLGSDATVEHNINTTAHESVELLCSMNTSPASLQNLRFYWQDERKYVLYSFNEGKEMPEHINELYRDRITTFPQEMIRGNISIRVKSITLEDNKRVFEAFAEISDPRGIFQFRKICTITLHVAVPYINVSLAVNEETRTAVCSAQRGFPEPLVKWSLHFLSNNSQCLVASSGVTTRAVQDPQDHLYSFSSTIGVQRGLYQSVTCFIHNPTLNVTLNATRTLNKGEAQRSVPGRAVALTVAVVVLLAR